MHHLQKILNLQSIWLNYEVKKNNDNNNNENNNNNGNNLPPLLCSLPQPPTPPSSPPDDGDGESDDDDDENRNLTPTKRFLLDQPQRTAVAVGANNAATSMPLQKKGLDLLKILAKYFLKQMIYLNWIINPKY